MDLGVVDYHRHHANISVNAMSNGMSRAGGRITHEYDSIHMRVDAAHNILLVELY